MIRPILHFQKGLLIPSLGLLMALLPTALAAADMQILQRHEDWTSYKSGQGKAKICFAATTPKDSTPKNVNRDDILFYVSNWPSQKVREEVSIKIGYPLQPKSQPTVQIDEKIFDLYPRGDKLFITDSQEKLFVKAMRKGKKMVVTGLSKRGTTTKDVYSLIGISAALESAKKACH